MFSLSSGAPAVARIKPGDSVVLDTADCFSDQLRSPADRPDAVDWQHINPATGPVFVEGAEPGDVLSVPIESVDVADRGVMAVSGDFGVLRDRFEGVAFTMIPIDGGAASVAGASAQSRVDVRRDLQLANPVVETPDGVASIASAETLDVAAEIATRDMADLLAQRLGLSDGDATMLMSAAGQLQVSQVVDPLKTARYAMPKEILARFGLDLL
ncbi:MAG TPA: acetamidase/formamidase family protein [Thermoleophilia bacterium]|nr:acetamidase/formamidase family protein [Thermoleophilia bacterium]